MNTKLSHDLKTEVKHTLQSKYLLHKSFALHYRAGKESENVGCAGRGGK